MAGVMYFCVGNICLLFMLMRYQLERENMIPRILLLLLRID